MGTDMYFICIPAYNEIDNIEKVLFRTGKAMESRDSPYRIIVYDDGSTDGTGDRVEKCSGALPVTLIRGGENRGLTHGLNVLFSRVIELSGEEEDVAVVLEGDNTQSPDQILTMVDKINEGFDVVIASRFQKGSQVVGIPPGRNVLSLGAGLLMKVLFPFRGVKDYTCGYRAYRTSILAGAQRAYGELILEAGDFACTAELLIKLAKLGALIGEIPIVLRYDFKGSKSKMRILPNIISTLKMLMRLKFSPGGYGKPPKR